MKRMCTTILMCILVPTILLIGCSSNKEKNEAGTSKEINNLKINPEQVVYTDKCNKTDNTKIKKVAEVTFYVKNTGEKELGIGAGDFSMFDEEGNNLELYGYPDNFGDVVASG
ncbi:hypothetical protein COK06_00015 [Bacillus cereus]|nr:hypothetical protein COI72_02400 [Bacillus cereus]PFQ00501.1 hypothetical protein COK06_00015 [Bacillus cereus]